MSKRPSKKIGFLWFAALVLITVQSPAQTKPKRPGRRLSPAGAMEARSPRADSLAAFFKQPDYSFHSRAEERLIDEQKEAIPSLIAMLSDTSYQKLVNTADLIYPGATQFYGHGHIVSYELDWVAVRAGWLLEAITFENLGYSGRAISEAQLMALHIENYAAYLRTGSHQVQLSSPVDKVQFRSQLLDLAKIAKAWWESNRSTWTRFGAIKKALESEDSVRQLGALSYLRFARTDCDGLTAESFKTDLLPAVQNLVSSADETISDQARRLLDDGFSWTHKDFRKSLKQ